MNTQCLSKRIGSTLFKRAGASVHILASAVPHSRTFNGKALDTGKNTSVLQPSEGDRSQPQGGNSTRRQQSPGPASASRPCVSTAPVTRKILLLLPRAPGQLPMSCNSHWDGTGRLGRKTKTLPAATPPHRRFLCNQHILKLLHGVLFL